MNTTEKDIDLQVQLWGLLGPMLAIATAGTLILKGGSINVYLSWVLLLGILISWKWKVKGFAMALTGLAIFSIYQYNTLQVDELAWHLGVSAAIALTYLVTALCYDEIETIVEGIQKESSSRLKSLMQLDETLESLQLKKRKNDEVNAEKIQELQSNVAAYKRLIEATREEMYVTHQQQEKLLEELFQKRHEVEMLKVEKVQLPFQPSGSLPNAPNYQAMYKQLREQFEEKAKLLDEARRQLFLAKEESEVARREYDLRQLDRSDTEVLLEKTIIEREDECLRLKQENEALEELLDDLMRQKT